MKGLQPPNIALAAVLLLLILGLTCVSVLQSHRVLAGSFEDSNLGLSFQILPRWGEPGLKGLDNGESVTVASYLISSYDDIGQIQGAGINLFVYDEDIFGSSGRYD